MLRKHVEEAQNAESKPDFIHKMTISLKEARETNYWLKISRYLRTKTGYVESSRIIDH